MDTTLTNIILDQMEKEENTLDYFKYEKFSELLIADAIFKLYGDKFFTLSEDKDI